MLSILIDTFNHEGFIGTAIESVLEQSWLREGNPHEIVVVDDGSTDGTPAVLASYGDRIRVVTKVNGGQASAFAEGLRHCSGAIVAFLDGDDWWHPEKLAAVMAEFAAHPECVAVGHGITVVDELSGVREDQGPTSTVVLNFAHADAIAPFHSHMAFLGTSRLAARREALDRLDPPPLALTYEADEHFFTLLPALGDVRILPRCLTCYRLHGANLYQASNALSGRAMDDSKLRKRATIFRCLADSLPAQLQALGVAPDRAAAIVEPLELQASRLELQAGNGGRWRTYAVERRMQAWLAGRDEAGGTLVGVATLAAALLLPPPSFYALRNRYAGYRARRQSVSSAQGKDKGAG